MWLLVHVEGIGAYTFWNPHLEFEYDEEYGIGTYTVSGWRMMVTVNDWEHCVNGLEMSFLEDEVDLEWV